MRRIWAAALLVAGTWTFSACKERDDTGRLASATGPGGGAALRAKHVHMMHLDGFRPDVFRLLLDQGSLPHFAALLKRGRISYEAATVDKTETFKVIQSYLTSKRDTEITAWWQWDRRDMQFHNYWIDPTEVANYALGLQFPLAPTIFDLLAAKGEAVTAGFSLHRRSVPFNNYTRNYVEGYAAVSGHTYFDQAHATMSSIRELYERKAKGDPRMPGEKFPAFSNSVLAAADEFGHLEGVVAAGPEQHCFKKSDAGRAPFFKALADNPRLKALASRYFSKVSATELCLKVPSVRIAGYAEPQRVNPNYALGFVFIDMQVGLLLDTLTGIRMDAAGKTSYAPFALDAALDWGTLPADSLLGQTAFVMLGDHGMVDTKQMFTTPNTLIAYLSDELGLSTGDPKAAAPAAAQLGIDDTQLPAQLAFPHRDTSWQSAEIRKLSQEADAWAKAFLGDVKDALREDLYHRYWWLFFLRSFFIDPRLNSAIGSVETTAVDTLAKVYLKGEPKYVEAERKALRGFYEKQVRLVYGGGAKNNLELFLPSGSSNWDKRPTRDEVVGYRDGRLIKALLKHPSVGLIFVRRGNERLQPGAAVPARLVIEVQDREGARGLITVTRDDPTGQLLFAYRVEEGSPGDPLKLGTLGSGAGTAMTYNEWHDAGAAGKHAYPGVVAGVGGYLYSTNPSIGDITVMHSDNWNFGDNAGGHGGVHAEEKHTVMLVSGPGVTPGELWATAPYSTEGGKIVAKPVRTRPTVLDAAPTALTWLGYGEGALGEFARSGEFEKQLEKWVAMQQDDILGNLDHIDDVNAALAAAGFDAVRISKFKGRLARLLKFLPEKAPKLPDLSRYREDGNLLELGGQ